MASFTVATQMQQLGNAVRAKAPQGGVGLDPTRFRPSARHRQIRAQQAGCLAVASQHAATTEFAAQRAVAFRVGLMIALLAYRPMDTQKHLPLPEGKRQFRAVAGCE